MSKNSSPGGAVETATPPAAPGSAIVLHADATFEEPLLIDVIDKEGRVFIGNVVASSSQKCILRHRITHVVNVTCDRPNVFESDGSGSGGKRKLTYLRVPVEDRRGSGWPDKLAAMLPGAVSFVSEALATNPKSRVLIHCNRGTSRSGTVAVAWVMSALNLNLRDALKWVTDHRGPNTYTHPNEGFFKTCLIPWEEERWKNAGHNNNCKNNLVQASSSEGDGRARANDDDRDGIDTTPEHTNNTESTVSEDLQRQQKQQQQQQQQLLQQSSLHSQSETAVGAGAGAGAGGGGGGAVDDSVGSSETNVADVAGDAPPAAVDVAAVSAMFRPSLSTDEYVSNHGHGKPFNGKGRKM